MTATIETNSRREIVALDSSGNVIAKRSRYCNPVALQQLVSSAEIKGYKIDWENSTVANPHENE
jgi:hypothetical protein